jgi:hypothetical protein
MVGQDQILQYTKTARPATRNGTLPGRPVLHLVNYSVTRAKRRELVALHPRWNTPPERPGSILGHFFPPDGPEVVLFSWRVNRMILREPGEGHFGRSSACEVLLQTRRAKMLRYSLVSCDWYRSVFSAPSGHASNCLRSELLSNLVDDGCFRRPFVPPHRQTVPRRRPSAAAVSR